MNTDFVPEDVQRHIEANWPDRQRVSQRLAISVRQARADPSARGTLENDVATQLAIALTRLQWVMLTTTGPRWLLWDPRESELRSDFLNTHPEDFPRHALRDWDWQRQSPNRVPGSSLLICEIEGYAVPTFLEPAPAVAAMGG